MNYQGSQLLPHPPDRVWQALLDPQVLAGCIAGCEQFDRTGDNSYKSTVKITIGPVSARFTSTVALTDVLPPHSCTLQFSGQGGVAGFGKGEAKVRLMPRDGGAGTQLDWEADAHVGGRLAQIGSRLVEATVRKMSDDFFVRFAAQLDQPAPGATAVASPARESAAIAAAKPPVPWWARLVTLALAAGTVWWLGFKG
jgi:carbon monoxide dehydrogenase subunit G